MKQITQFFLEGGSPTLMNGNLNHLHLGYVKAIYTIPILYKL